MDKSIVCHRSSNSGHLATTANPADLLSNVRSLADCLANWEQRRRQTNNRMPAITTDHIRQPNNQELLQCQTVLNVRQTSCRRHGYKD